MRVMIRADASVALGSGHVMRCLTLAGSLRDAGHEVAFISCEAPGHLNEAVEQAGYPVFRLPPSSPRESEQVAEILARMGGVDWLVVDHYAWSTAQETPLRALARRILVIDDLADRPHDCDVLLDQNLCDGMESRYDARLPEGCRKLLGPRYALLRPEFHRAKARVSARHAEIQRLLIFFGGGDAPNVTEKALEAVSRIADRSFALDVVVGASNPHVDRLRTCWGALPGIAFHAPARDMADLMAGADLALGAGGTATWERCYLGLPALLLSIADNQVPLARAVAEAGAGWYLGPAEMVSVEALAEELQRILATSNLVAEASDRALALMEHHGQPPTLLEVMQEAGHVAA